MNLLRLLRDRRGATAIEYGLIAALIAVAMIAALRSTGLTLAGVFQTLTGAMGG